VAVLVNPGILFRCLEKPRWKNKTGYPGHNTYLLRGIQHGGRMIFPSPVIKAKQRVDDFLSRIDTGKFSDPWFLFPAVFLGSLLLSLIASLEQPIVGRDAMLYLSISLDPSISDVSAAMNRFNWPWYPLLIKFISGLSSISPERVARLLCEFMTAVACLLAVDIVRRNRPDLVGWAALLVLAVPAFNEYRGEILRENGFWCFSMLALWLMYVMKDARFVCRFLLVCLSIILAAAFRFEAVYILAVLVVAEISRIRGRWLKIIIVSGSMVLAVAILFWLSHHDLLPKGRISAYASYINSARIFNSFSSFTQYVALKMPKFSYKDTELIFFIGLCGYLIVKIAMSLGIFSLPWILSFLLPKTARVTVWNPMTVAATGYGIILLAFLFGNLFLSGRYVSFLGLLLLPGICAGVQYIVCRWSWSFLPVVLLSVVVAIANAVSLSEPKTFIRDAGLWITENIPDGARIYFEEPRMSYYAMRDYPHNNEDREMALGIGSDGAYEYFVLSLQCQPNSVIEQLKKKGMRLVMDFRNKSGCAVGIFRRDSA
jgi:hypothetical protein